MSYDDNEFKVGDKVVCVGSQSENMEKGGEFRVRAVRITGFGTEQVCLEGARYPEHWYTATAFKKVSPPKYKHDAIVRAWLEGEEIEFFNKITSEWQDVRNSVETTTTLPSFSTHYEYRIKPKKTERQLKIEELEQKLQELKAMED